MSSDQPSCVEEPGRASAAPALEYSSPALSPYDRPVEPVVRAARKVRLVVRILFWVFALAAFAFAAWAVWTLKSAFDAIGR
jgi:hypothetical protein